MRQRHGRASGSLLRERLRASGLSDAVGRRLRLEVLTAQQVRSLSSAFRSQAAIRIPYFTPAGRVTRFYRLRYVGPAPGFSSGMVAAQRYAQLPGTLNEVYLPPVYRRSWREVLGDRKQALLITEGELKAAAGCAHGIPTIGLGGVEMFRATRRGWPDLLPVLDQAEWQDREVYVVWDSDVVEKEGPIQAQRGLGYRLAERGARVRLLGLPPGQDGAKVGLDDYLLEHSRAELEAELETRGEPFEESDRLWEMNEDCLVVHTPPAVLSRRHDDMLMSAEKFQGLHHANQHMFLAGKRVSLPRTWLAWRFRAEVQGLTYQPGAPQLVGGQWNSWRRWGMESAPGDVRPLTALLDHMFADEPPAARQWLEQWLAYPIQHPGAKLFTAVLMWGTEGVGKTFVGEIMRDIYGENAARINAAQLHSPHNGWARNRQFILAEEVTGSDRRGDADHLKGLITQETLTINPKYIEPFTLRDTLNYFLTSNHPNALYLGDQDRRYFILHVHRRAAPEVYTRLDAWRRAGGAAHWRHHLEHISLVGFDPRAAAHSTVAKEEMVSNSRSELGRFAAELREDPRRTLSALGNQRALAECDLLTPTQVFRCFNPDSDWRRGTINALSREMLSMGFTKVNHGRKVMTRVGTQTLWVIRNARQWAAAPIRDAVRHWEQYWVGSKVD